MPKLPTLYIDGKAVECFDLDALSAADIEELWEQSEAISYAEEKELLNACDAMLSEVFGNA